MADLNFCGMCLELRHIDGLCRRSKVLGGQVFSPFPFYLAQQVQNWVVRRAESRPGHKRRRQFAIPNTCKQATFLSSQHMPMAFCRAGAVREHSILVSRLSPTLFLWNAQLCGRAPWLPDVLRARITRFVTELHYSQKIPK